MKLVVTLMLAL